MGDDWEQQMCTVIRELRGKEQDKGGPSALSWCYQGCSLEVQWHLSKLNGCRIVAKGRLASTVNACFSFCSGFFFFLIKWTLGQDNYFTCLQMVWTDEQAKVFRKKWSKQMSEQANWKKRAIKPIHWKAGVCVKCRGRREREVQPISLYFAYGWSTSMQNQLAVTTSRKPEAVDTGGYLSAIAKAALLMSRACNKVHAAGRRHTKLAS